MSQITRTYSFVDGTTAYGSQVESEIANIVNTWNNHDSGTSSWTSLKISGNITMAAGKTITIVSPDGTKTINFGLDNNGNFGGQ